MKKILSYSILFLITFLLIASGYFIATFTNLNNDSIFTETVEKVIPRPLVKYQIENLAKTKIGQGEFVLANVLSESTNFISYQFSFRFNPDLENKEIKTSTGQINLPAGNKKYPLIIMLRGYVDQELYKTGDGTKNAAKFFADNGFITIAPDFLGYAGSSSEADNIFESRFQTYVTVLNLFETLKQKSFNNFIKGRWNEKNIFIWGHSNGGQIALTVLEITAAEYPTVLWAPVSKPFPYSVLYYTDQSEDRGKLIRRELAKFEDLYDTDKYSLTEYLEEIKAPLQIHQGTADDAVPLNWTDDLVSILENLEKDVIYYTYSATDHNMRPNWNTVIERDLEFFMSYLNN